MGLQVHPHGFFENRTQSKKPNSCFKKERQKKNRTFGFLFSQLIVKRKVAATATRRMGAPSGSCRIPFVSGKRQKALACFDCQKTGTSSFDGRGANNRLGKLPVCFLARSNKVMQHLSHCGGIRHAVQRKKVRYPQRLLRPECYKTSVAAKRRLPVLQVGYRDGPK